MCWAIAPKFTSSARTRKITGGSSKEAGYHVKWLGKNDALSRPLNLSVSSWENDIGCIRRNRFAFGEAGYWSMLSEGGKKHANDTSARGPAGRHQGGSFHAEQSARTLRHLSAPECPTLYDEAPSENSNKWTLDQVSNT